MVMTNEDRNTGIASLDVVARLQDRAAKEYCSSRSWQKGETTDDDLRDARVHQREAAKLARSVRRIMGLGQ
jgi:hypothetical protein